MDQAQSAVCFADSDEEDFVAFDEADLNKGIADLYDDDSASDYNEDVEEEMVVNLDEMEQQMDMNQQQQHEMLDAELEELEELEAEMVAPSNYSSAAKEMFPTPQSESNKKSEEAPSKKRSFLSRFAARRKSSSDSPPMSAFSAAPSSSAAGGGGGSKKKKSKKSQLDKRIHRLRMKAQPANEEKAAKKVVHRQRVNTNIISVDLGTLKEAADNLATGDAFMCQSCKAVLSQHDELLKQYEEIKLDDDDQSIWVCAFCNHVNIIEIDPEEVPKSETVDYILAPPATQSDDKKTNTDESQIIFCIDISGSMCVSQQIDSKHSQFKLRGSHLNKEQDALSQFIDANAGHLNQQHDVQYVSRLQCVQTAVDEQISNMAKNTPNYKIGLVSFNSEVTVVGDGMANYQVVAGDKLNNMQKLREVGQQCVIAHNVGAAKQKLCDALWKLEENGQTALGPGLVVAIEMASTKAGSQVILCTDGLANIGVGSLEENANADQIEAEDDDEEEDAVLRWYQALGDYAMSKGVVVNIISITDDGCKLENLGKIVEITNGNLKRINPLNLAEKFSGIIENESIATNCQAKMILHPGLKFHSTVEAAQINIVDDANKPAAQTKSKKLAAVQEEKAESATAVDDDNATVAAANKDRNIYKVPRSVQDCGNVFEGSRIFFEYVINKEQKAAFKSLKQLPFQTQIEYSKKDGSKMLRVISQTKEVTLDKQKVRQNLDFNVLAKYGTHVTTELAAKGDYESSRAWTSANTTFMNKNAINKRQLLTLANYAQENVALDHQMQRQLHVERDLMIPEQGFGQDLGDDVAFNPLASGVPAAAPPSKPSVSSKKKKMKNRKAVRNDEFSSHIYNMKKKSHK